MSGTAPDWQQAVTADGSPTLVHPVTGEAMHNRAGAWGETLHVYGRALAAATDRGFPLRVLSVGLGLGYCEIAAMAHALAAARPLHISSFEADAGLRAGFQRWQDGEDTPSPCQQIAVMAGGHYGVPVAAIRTGLRTSVDIKGALTPRSVLEQGLGVIFFDAFSSTTSPDLWDPILLDHILQHTGPHAVFATYAATGALRRQLTEAGFTVERIAGFAGKRHSTLAVRG